MVHRLLFREKKRMSLKPLLGEKSRDGFTGLCLGKSGDAFTARFWGNGVGMGSQAVDRQKDWGWVQRTLLGE